MYIVNNVSEAPRWKETTHRDKASGPGPAAIDIYDIRKSLIKRSCDLGSRIASDFQVYRVLPNRSVEVMFVSQFELVRVVKRCVRRY
jgi:hypothetical protein